MDKEDIIKGLSIGLLITSIIFIAGAFIQWDINPGNWSEAGRVFVGVFSTVSIILSLAIQST